MKWKLYLRLGCCKGMILRQLEEKLLENGSSISATEIWPLLCQFIEKKEESSCLGERLCENYGIQEENKSLGIVEFIYFRRSNSAFRSYRLAITVQVTWRRTSWERTSIYMVGYL